MKLSVVTTLYFSAPSITEFYERITRTVKKITEDYEILFVNDGSPDNSLEIALALHAKDDKVSIIDLSRNFGHHKAIMTGLLHSRGDYVFLIDVDLEEEPELLERYWDQLKNLKDADVIYGIQTKRKGSWFTKMTGNLFYLLINFLSDEEMPRNFSLSRLMSRRYVRSLIRFRERTTYIAGLWHITGYKQIGIPIDRSPRGVSTYTLKKKIALFLNAVTSFSEKPLVLIFNVGLSIFLLSVVASLFLIIKKLFFSYILSGWTSAIVIICLFSGLIILFIGMIGIYLSRVFIETKNRPYSIIRSIYRRDEN